MDEGERKGLACYGEFQPLGSRGAQEGSRVVYRSGIMWHMAYNWDAVFEAIRVERARQKWSQAELAKRAGEGVSQGTVKNLEGARAYKRPPIGALQAIDRAFGWPVGTLEEKLGVVGAPTIIDELSPEDSYIAEPMSEDDLTVVLHHVVYDLMAHTAPETSLAELKELEARAIRVALSVGRKPPRRRTPSNVDDDPEP
jgi:transcriptional regulator with XRE-family HTH domain